MNGLLVFVLSPDTSSERSLARIDYTNTPEQCQMEMLAAKITNKNDFCDADGNFLPVYEWPGVTCVEVEESEHDDEPEADVQMLENGMEAVENDNHNPVDVEMEHNDEMDQEIPDEPIMQVTMISWFNIEGTLCLEWIPAEVTDFEVRATNLTLEGDLLYLPGKLHTLSLQECRVPLGAHRTATDFARFPKEMRTLRLLRCLLAGTIETKYLPRELGEFEIESNLFSGTFDFTSLPPTLETLDIHLNFFGGTVCLTGLPLPLRTLSLSFNRFHGTVDLHTFENQNLQLQRFGTEQSLAYLCISGIEFLPQSIQYLNISKNTSQKGEIFKTGALPERLEEISAKECQLSGRLETVELPKFLIEFNTSCNNLSGTICFYKLPRGLQLFDVQQNMLEGLVHLHDLPPGLREISLNDNAFTGGIMFGSLPGNMQTINISRNPLCGGVEICKLPVSLTEIIMEKCQFTGPMRVGFPPTARHLIQMKSSGITSVIDVNGNEMPRTTMEYVKKASKEDPEYFFIE